MTDFHSSVYCTNHKSYQYDCLECDDMRKKAASVVAAYKGFDLQMKCRDMQYAVGQTYKHEGKVKACSSGLHSCENPLDVFSYYAPGQSVYALVTAGGTLSRHSDDSKIASAELHIERSLTLHELIAAAVAYRLTNSVEPVQHATGYQSAASATGYQSAASATGDRSAASNTGDRSAASATGNQSAASATGDRSAASATGYQSAASATGYQSAASATGDRSAASATGYQSAASATGYQSAASATGYQSAASATGYQSAVEALGLGAVALATGSESRGRAAKGGAFCLVHRGGRGIVLNVVVGVPGSNGIEADVWYSLDAKGELVRV